jgi:hypothetical protein
MPWACICTRAMTGQALQRLAQIIVIGALSLLPIDVGVTWIERQFEPTLAVRKYANRYHDALVLQSRLSFQVEKYSHVVSVVCSVEASDVDEALA